MNDAAPTWIVMIRDISHAARVAGQSQIVASLILDADTGLVRGGSVAASSGQACGDAMRTALTQPAGPLPPVAPGSVVYSGPRRDVVLAELERLLPGESAPALLEVGPIAEAEDVFDSLVGHMAGRQQPDDPPGPDDWAELYARIEQYWLAEPWDHRSDEDHLDLIVKVDGAPQRYVAVVLGQAGIQRGLALYPGAVFPDDIREPLPGAAARLPAGALLLWLDPPAEVPPEFAGKAERFGWPSEADLLPVALTTTAEGPADLDRGSAHILTVAIAAVLARDDAGDNGGGRPGRTTGDVMLPGGSSGSFSIA